MTLSNKDKKEDKFLANYWNSIAAGICQLLNKEGIKLS